MLFSYAISLNNKLSLLHFIRGFIHLTVLVSLIVYQFLFSLFLNPYLSISVYSLCSVILLFDSLYVYFYKDNKLFNNYFNFALIFLDACFFAILLTVLGFVALPYILFLTFLEIAALSVFGGWFSGMLFSFVIALLLPLSFIWHGDLSYENRKSLLVFVIFSLLMHVIFGVFLHYFWEKLSQKFVKIKEPEFLSKKQLKPKSSELHLESSLDLSRKIKPALNSLVKSFLDSKNKESLSKYYENQLNQLNQFIGKYIEYSEAEDYRFKATHLPKFLENLLNRLQSHKDRPASLKEVLDYKSSTEWVDCSSEQLERAIENIIENSFQALKNEVNSKIEIKIYDEVGKIVLEFIDNGHGIEGEDIKNVFNLLFSKRLGLGGVGLAYVLKTVKAHKGDVDILSSSQGTRVIIKLPISPSHKSKLSLSA